MGAHRENGLLMLSVWKNVLKLKRNSLSRKQYCWVEQWWLISADTSYHILMRVGFSGRWLRRVDYRVDSATKGTSSPRLDDHGVE